MPLSPVISPKLHEKHNIKHGFFTRQGGISKDLYENLNTGYGSDDERDNITQNRALIAQHFDIKPERLLSVHQIHSATCITAINPWRPEEAPKADSMVTNIKGLALGVLTADCGPILFADTKNKVIGAAHSGWRGAIGGIIESTIKAMENLGAERPNIIAATGPMIGYEAYEVGAEFFTHFMRRNEEYRVFFKKGKKIDHFHFNLPAFIRNRLDFADIRTIDNLDLCTYSDPKRFFSYRRSVHQKEPDYGRLMSVIMLTKT